MKKKNPYHWFFGIPEFHAAHMFVYLNDLNTSTSTHQSINMAKRNLYAAAKSSVQTAASLLAQNSDSTNSAMDFLKAIADSERNKELRIIKDYEQQLRATLPPNDRTINKLLSQLNGNILDNPQDLTEFYMLLTKYINEVRQKNLEYQTRLRQLAKHQTEHAMKDLAKDNYLYRATGDITSMFHQLQRNAIARQKDKADSFAGKVRDLATDYILQSGLLNHLSSGEDIMAVFALVILDVEKKFQEVLDKNHFNDFTDFLEHEDIFNEVASKYLEATNLEETRLQKAINSDMKDLDVLLNDAKRVLGIKELGTHGKDAELRAIADEQASKRKDENQKIYQKLSKNSKNKALKDLKYVTFSTKSTGIHGNIFELIQEMLSKNTINIQGNVAADLIHLGSLEFNIAPNNVQSQLMTYIQTVEQDLTKFDREERKNRKDDQTKRIKALNDTINENISKLEEQAKTLIPDIENLFVYHESLKLYKTAESDSDFSGFHGREMAILNYMDEMYSANSINLTLPDKSVLQLLALNLGNGAVGAEYKGTLEHFFSIFAGLLMFDDLQNMATEAQQALSNKGVVKQIHLYNLNGIYVPASMILSFTYNLMSQAQTTIEEGYAASAAISTSGASDAIAGYLDSRPTPIIPQWTALGEAAATGTHVRVRLLASFTKLIEGLNSI